MKRTLESTLLVGLTLLVVSCRHTSSSAAQLELQQRQALLLPALPHPGVDPQALADLQQELYLQLSALLPGPVIDGAQVAALPALLGHHDLMPDGLINSSELAAIGRTLECESVILVDVRALCGIPPFTAALQVAWVRVRDGALVTHRQLAYSLSHEKTRDGYHDYLDHVYDPGSETRDSAARLSPRAFRQYIVSQALQALMTTPDNLLITLKQAAGPAVKEEIGGAPPDRPEMRGL